jgi:hypothetical protein
VHHTSALQPLFVGKFKTSHCDVRFIEEFKEPAALRVSARARRAAGR